MVEDDLWWKTTFGGRQPMVEDDLWWKTILACSLVRSAAFSLYVDGTNVYITVFIKKYNIKDDFLWCSVRRGVSHAETLVDKIYAL